jgi:hypothetical protein
MDEKRSKTYWLKILIGIAFFPFTSTYLIWKSSLDRKIKIGVIIGFWVLFILVANSSKGNNNATENIATDITTAPTQVISPTLIIASPTPLIVTPSSEPTPKPPFATITYSNRYMLIKNLGNTKLTSCLVTIGYGSVFSPNTDYYEADFGDIPANSIYSLPWSNITKQDGTRFDYYKNQPQDVELDCTVNGADRSMHVN